MTPPLAPRPQPRSAPRRVTRDREHMAAPALPLREARERGQAQLDAYGVLDTGYRWDLSVEEARELGRRAIFQATFRDAYSGGTVSVYHVTEKGWEKVSGDDCYNLYQKYNPEPAPPQAAAA